MIRFFVDLTFPFFVALWQYKAQKLPDWPADQPKLSIRGLAKKYGVPYATLYKRISGEVTIIGHASGGKGRSRVLSKKVEGKKTESTPLIC